MNLTSAQQLENLDGAKFQLLVNALLAQEPHYRALIETGANSRGQTIKSPLDAFCLVPYSQPPHFVLVEHTTTSVASAEKDGNLGTKWKSDLAKAIAKAHALKETHIESIFTVVLTSSHRPSEPLLQDVYLIAAQGGIRLDIWEQSRIARALDTTPHGHYLRYKYLGIAAEMLSPALLRKLCQRSLEDYEGFIGFVGEEITRQEEEPLRASLTTDRLHFVVGDSGSGKSTLLWRSARSTMQSEGLALWMPASYVGAHQSLLAALRQRLRDLCPSLLEVGLDELLYQCVSSDNPLVLFVDDPNQESNPSQIVSRLLAWMRPAPRAKEETSGSPPCNAIYRMVCPLWPSLWSAHSSAASGWCGVTFLQVLSTSDATKLVTQLAASASLSLLEHDALQLAELLSCDPFLIGLWGELLLTQELPLQPLTARELATNTLENYVTDKCYKAEVKSSRYVLDDYRGALHRFASLLLEKRELTPSWLTYQEWLRETNHVEDAHILRDLGRQCSLWRLSSEAHQTRATFRHDRLRQFFLVQAAEALLQRVESQPNNDVLDLYGDPFFAEVCGEAICRLAPPEAQEWLWDHLLEHNPLALAMAYRGFALRRARPLTAPERRCRDFLLDQLTQWATQAQTKPELEATVAEIGKTFQNVDDVQLATALAPLGGHWAIGLALFRNGVLSRGLVRYLVRDWDLLDPRREPALVYGREHHRTVLTAQVSRKLTEDFHDKEGAEDWRGALVAAGVLGVGELIEPLQRAWSKVPPTHQQGFLPLFLWATLHCFQKPFEDAAHQFLHELFEVWAALSDECQEERGGMSDRSEVGHELHHIIFNQWPETALEFLTDTASKRPELTHPLRIALSRVDSPLVLNFFVLQKNQREDEYSTMFLFDIWSSHWGRHRRYLCSESLQRARELWQDTTLTDRARQLAFHYWKTNPDGDDPSLLSQINPSDPFYTDALQTRIQRGDLSVVPEILPKLQEGTFFWNDAARIWCPAIKDATKILAAKIQSDQAHPTDETPNFAYELIRVLRDAPATDTEEILLEFWDQLSQFASFLPLALWIGTPRCLQAVKDKIDSYPTSVHIFGHLMFRLSIWPKEGEEEKARPQVLRFLRNILPYWDRVDDLRYLPVGEHSPKLERSTRGTSAPTPEEIMAYMATKDSDNLIEAAFRVREFDWARQHLYDVITDKQKQRFFPSDEDLARQLDNILEQRRTHDLAHHARGAVYSYFRLNERNGIELDRLLDVLLTWLDESPDLPRLQLATSAVGDYGKRQHIERLQDTFAQTTLVESENRAMSAVIANAQFTVWQRGLD